MTEKQKMLAGELYDAIIGAGSIVTRGVAPGMTVAGNPARSLKR
jgi:acetyltransferase-like isoleucine patch superfamily enzyme